MSKLRFIVVSFLSFVICNLTFVIPSFAQSPWSDGFCVAKGTDVATIQGIECLFANVLQVIVLLAGLAFFFMFISGGFQYLLSQGDPKKVAASGSTLTSAFLGLIGVIGSWLILRLIENFTGLTLTQFKIPF
jgi:hypothetical protein